MISRRRLTLQLTPLLDMLLIVVFLQYFQLRDREQSLAGEQEAIATERAETQTHITDLVKSMDALRSKLAQAQEQTTYARDLATRERESLIQSQGSLQRTLDQQRVVGELVHELFKIPPEQINELLNSARGPGSAQSQAERDKVVQQFRRLSEQSSGKVLEHLLSYEEIRKRCDVWNLHVDANGIITASDGVRTRLIRIPFNDDGDIIVEQLLNELFTWYRTLPQSKSLVVILLTYDRDTRIFVTESIRSAMPEWVHRMNTDSAGRSRYEYADLGFRIE